MGAALLALGLGMLVALLAPPGQPYDEPAHHANVVYYAEHHRLPVLGDADVHYEGQMGPGYYVPAALLLVATGTTDEPRAGLMVLRLAGLVLIPLLAWSTHRLARALGGSAVVSGIASGVVVLNPSMLAISSSVQNDYLCFTLACLAALVAIRALRPGASLWWSLAAGALIGLAVLVKVFAGGLLVGLVAAMLLDRHRRWRSRCAQASTAVTAMAAVSGWWFIRNLRLYGDLTGGAGVERTGRSFPPLHFDGLGSVLDWGRSLISYAFAPTEYYRNAFDAPVVVKAVAVLMTGLLVVLVVGHLAARRRSVVALVREPRVVFVLVSVTVVVVVYTVAAWTMQSIAPRLMFVAAPPALALLARAARESRAAQAVGALLVFVFVLIDVWLVVQLAGTTVDPRLFPWGGTAVPVAS